MTKANSSGNGRRNFLRATGLSAAALAAAKMGLLDSSSRGGTVKAAPLPNHKRLVVLTFRGGNDGLNTVIPSANARYFDRRPTIQIPDSDSLALTGGPGNSTYRLHPNLGGIQQLWNEGRVAIVNKVGYPNANLSHFVSEDIWSYGVRGQFVGLGVGTSGWIARFVDRYAPTPLGAVSIGQGRPKDFVGGSNAPLIVSSLAGFNLSNDGAYTQNDILRKSTVRGVLDNTQWKGKEASVALAITQAQDLTGAVQQAINTYTSTVTYPAVNIGNQLRDVARLIQAGYDTRLFYVGFGGFDTHSAQTSGAYNTGHDLLMQRFNDAMAAFAQDMKSMGIWQDITVVVVSEFGRRNFENGSTGTDHGHGNPAFLIGGAVNGGMYGDDITNANLDANYLGYETDFRAIYKDVVAHMGFDPDPLFPEALAKPGSPGAILP
jgi:uncharacterized protein (DUF1501 family)